MGAVLKREKKKKKKLEFKVIRPAKQEGWDKHESQAQSKGKTSQRISEFFLKRSQESGYFLNVESYNN